MTEAHAYRRGHRPSDQVPPLTAACRSCRHAVGWKRKVEGWLCSRGYAFAAVAGGLQLPSRPELRRADLTGGAECQEWAAWR